MDFLRDISASKCCKDTGCGSSRCAASDGAVDSLTKQKTIEENCGVFGVVGKENASRVVFFGLYALNHREYNSCAPSAAYTPSDVLVAP